MRIFILTFVLTAAAWSAVVPARGAVVVLEQRNGNIVLDVRFDRSDRSNRTPVLDPGFPRVQFERVFVAVPSGDIRVSQTDAVFEDRMGSVPPRNHDPNLPAREPGLGLWPSQPVRVSGPFTFRNTVVYAIDCFVSQVDYGKDTERVWSGYRVRISYAPASAIVPHGQVDALVAGLVANDHTVPAAFPRPGASGFSAAAPDPHFSLSSNWIKIFVDQPGIYAVEGSDLAGMGINLSSIVDPTSFRLFTGTGQMIDVPLSSAEGTYQPDQWMTECDIQVDYGGDGTFDLSDRVVFYGVGTPGWSDLYSPGSARDEYTDHLYVDRNIYYLTWDDSPGFAGTPRRMTQIAAAPVAAGDLTTFEDRQYFEIDRIKDYTFGGDGWLWLEALAQTGSQLFPLPRFSVTNLVTSRPQVFRTAAVAKAGASNANHHAEYLINNVMIGDWVWDGVPPIKYADAEQVSISGQFLAEGSNDPALRVPRDLNPMDFMYFSWYAVFYEKQLRAVGDELFFSSPDTSATVNFDVGGLSTLGSPVLFDVTDHLRPRVLTGFVESTQGGSRNIRFSATVTGDRRYLWAGTSNVLPGKNPASMIRYFPVDLRNVSTAPHMLIVTHPTFLSAAQRLQQHRLANLPPFSSPVVTVATTEEIFDNFSGGLDDPMAIRNYCKFLYDNYTDGSGNPLLTYLLLLGDANADFKNISSTQQNLVTTNLNLQQFDLDSYVTDDFFAYLDTTDTPGSSFLDIAVGRMPASSRAEASFLVDRVINYELSEDFDTWRDRVILLADDEVSTFTNVQLDFVFLSEFGLANSALASYIDPHKIYLTEFPAIQGVKPSARAQFISDWNDGALAINYVGHGSSVQLADEQVFVASDVGALRNGLRLPFFVGMSCTVGDFAEQTKSLSERLLLKDGGGVIATLTASELTFVRQNDGLSLNFWRRMFPTQPGPPTSVGVNVLLAKNALLASRAPSRGYQENSEKYNLLGDPALRLLSPRRTLQFTSAVDSFVTGKRVSVRGTVYQNGQPDPTFNGTVRLVVREPDDDSGYTRESDGFFIPYRYPGGTTFFGTADVIGGDFEFSFKIPRSMPTGRWAFLLAYADDGSVDAIALNNTLEIVAPSPTDTTALFPSDGPPRVDFGFQGGLKTVKPGAVLVASVADADGVNILRTTPEGRMALVIDNESLPLDVTDFFRFDHGGIDTTGTMEFPLPTLDVGPHRAVFKVSDTFGQTTLDTLMFTMTDPLDYSAEVVLNYPNPFASSTYFLVDLTDRASIRLDIFSVSGNRIQSIETKRDAGEQWILWDGRDWTGSSIANGTYLYVARVTFAGLDRPPLVIRGKVVKIE